MTRHRRPILATGMKAPRCRTALSVLATVVVLAAVGCSATAPAGNGATATATTSGSPISTPARPAPAPGVITVDVQGAPLTSQDLAVPRQVLAAARAHDSTALDKLLASGGSQTAAALNKVLAQPGVYGQIVTLLTRTHAAGQDGVSIWPSFLLAGTGIPLAVADLKVLGVASPQAYKGIVISIGSQYHMLGLVSIAQNTA